MTLKILCTGYYKINYPDYKRQTFCVNNGKKKPFVQNSEGYCQLRNLTLYLFCTWAYL